eukprot:6743439-Pyramimonas_sp.AAC.1
MVQRSIEKRQERKRCFVSQKAIVMHPGGVKPSLEFRELQKWNTAKALKAINAPTALIRLCLLVCTKMTVVPTFDQVEFMAGKAACTRAALNAGKQAFPYDICQASPRHCWESGRGCGWGGRSYGRLWPRHHSLYQLLTCLVRPMSRRWRL